MKTAFLVLLPVVVAGCAVTPSQPQAVAAADTADKVCTREYRVGSTLPVTTCRTREQIAAEQQEVERTKDAIRRTTTIPGGSGPAGL